MHKYLFFFNPQHKQSVKHHYISEVSWPSAQFGRLAWFSRFPPAAALAILAPHINYRKLQLYWLRCSGGAGRSCDIQFPATGVTSEQLTSSPVQCFTGRLTWGLRLAVSIVGQSWLRVKFVNISLISIIADHGYNKLISQGCRREESRTGLQLPAW